MQLDIMKVRKLLKDKFGYQSKFAKAMGMDAGQLSHYLKGTYNPLFPALDLMARTLEVAVEEIILDAKMGTFLNDAVNTKHQLVISMLQGGQEVFNREFELYKADDSPEGRERFVSVLKEIDALLGEKILPNAEMVIGKPDDDTDEPPQEGAESGRFKDQLRQRAEQTV